MPVIVVGTEKSFAALRPRLFAGKVSNKVAGEVADRLRTANPHANLDKLTPGTVLTIPDSPHVQVQGELSLDQPTVDGLKRLGDHGKATLAGIVAAAEQREAETRQERARTLASLDAVAPTESGLADEVAAAHKALTEEDERAEQRTAMLKQAQSEWTEGLEALEQRLG